MQSLVPVAMVDHDLGKPPRPKTLDLLGDELTAPVQVALVLSAARRRRLPRTHLASHDFRRSRPRGSFA
jgi:hypothetical protein